MPGWTPGLGSFRWAGTSCGVPLLRLWLLTAVFVVVGLLRSHQVGVPFRDPGGAFFLTRVGLSAALFAGFVVLEALLRAGRGHRRPADLIASVRTRWTTKRLLTAWAALLAYHVVYLTYHNLKSWNDLRDPQDATLTAVDSWLFLGHSPAALLHQALGEQVAAHALIVIYESFGTLVVLVVAASVFTPRVWDGVRVLGSMIWVWILGTACYYAIPSLGPFHERPQDFAGLPVSVVTRTQARYLAQRDDLLADPRAHDAFAQVAAFASLHVGVATVITLMAARLGLRRSAWVLRVFLLLTCVATIYLGWHFFVDVPAGLLIGWLAVQLGAFTSRERAGGRPATPRCAHVAGSRSGGFDPQTDDATAHR